MIRSFDGLVIWVVCILTLVGCTSEARRRLEPTPNAVGALNQVAIIADRNVWEGPIGDSINYYYGSAYPILPTPEPIFDLKHFTPEELAAEPTRKELKAYIIIGNIADQGSSTGLMIGEDLGEEKVRRAIEDPTFNTNMGRNRWAKDQVLVYLFAKNDDLLTDQVVKKFPSIAKIIEEQYSEQIDASTYLGGTNHTLGNRVNELFGVNMRIPVDYKVTVEDDSTFWIMRENELYVTNILMHKLPYVSQDQFSQDSIIALRDALGRKYVSSSVEGSHMQTNPVDLPVYTKQVELGGAYAVEARGIWEMDGDFLGGPFISYLVLDKAKAQLIFIDAFVLAPGERKRNQMLYLEHIISSLEFGAQVN